MELRQIQYFLEAAKYSNFTSAAKNCYVSQSTLSEQIQKLEIELGCSLFERTKRKVQLTSEGELLRRHCEIIMKLIENTKDELKEMGKGLTGRIEIGVLPTVALSWFPPFMKRFLLEFPEIQINMRELSSENAEKCLSNYEIDLAISTIPSKDPNLDKNILYTEKMVLIVPENHRITKIKSDKINIDEIDNEQLIIYKKGQGLREILLNAFFQSNIRPNITLEIERAETIKYLVQNGHGVALIPETAVTTDNQFERLFYYNLQEPIERTVGILTRKNCFQSKHIQLFINRLVQIEFVQVRQNKGWVF